MPEPDEYLILVDPEGTAEGAAVLDVSAGPDGADLAEALAALYARDAEFDHVVLQDAGTTIGVVTRRRLGALAESGLRAIGDGDHAALPGPPLRFTPVRLRCDRDGCAGGRVLLALQSPDLPGCPQDASHGPMTLVA
ncbi:hypothetical protein EDD29_3596 [Actinocorallia herbida]|uniref:Uncharacterized protein n=1 Tax=Actinocorallia herbida TaxID=58109 RepID=A0A3N1CXQ8_9ACTN|nr:hypothetical protein [Actinocorallia herbida]ROO86035.1 hypothetical protein EDD29_3596 [Actinocorallia herbida]